MKKVLFTLFAAVLMLILPTTGVTAYEAPSFDSSGSYYEICNAEQLYWFAEMINNGFIAGADSDCKLMNDIDLNPGYAFAFDSDTGLITVTKNGAAVYLGTGIKGDSKGENETFDTDASVLGAFYSANNDKTAVSSAPADLRFWTPIGVFVGAGNADIFYSGTFDGNGKTISGMFIGSNSWFQGFFAAIDNGKVNDLTVNGCVSANSYVSGICPYLSSGTISGCVNNALVCNAADFTGGVCGQNTGAIVDCFNNGTVVGVTSCVGGVSGYNDGSLNRCANNGTVIGMQNNVGGVCGNNYRGVMMKCFNTGAVIGTGDNIGGACGKNENYMEYCFNTGTVEGTAYVGGICGKNRNLMKNNYYLSGCAVDGNGTIQNGSGNAEAGLTTADEEGGREGKAAELFADGSVCYLLNGDQSSIVFGQKIGRDALPVFGGMRVYYDENATPEYYNGITDIAKSEISLTGSAIRLEGIQGLRFKAQMTSGLFERTVAENRFEVVEYGILAKATTNTAELAYYAGNEAINGGIAKSASYIKDTATGDVSRHIRLADTENGFTFSSVLVDFPTTSEAYNAQFDYCGYAVIFDGSNTYAVLTDSATTSIAYVARELLASSYAGDINAAPEFISHIINMTGN